MKNTIIKMLLLVLGIILNGYNGFAQDYECGTEVTTQMAQEIFAMRQSRETANLKSMGAVTNVVVQPHIVSNNAGKFGLDKNKLSMIESNLNAAFSSVGFQFTFCSPNEIKNTDYYFINAMVTDEEKEMASRYNHKNAVNIYFLKNVPTSYTWLPGGHDWIIIKNSHVDNISTVAHEMGHYFGLMHTHGAKNPARFERVKRGGPPTDPCPYNWNVWGDGFEDTPADIHTNMPGATGSLKKYVTLSGSTCTFDGFPDTDDCGDTYAPDITNIMSYSYKICRTVFSQDQIDEMVAIRQNHAERKNLASSCGGVISPNCSDNVMNGDETGRDCGGSCPSSCYPTSNIVDFGCETGCANNLILVCGAVSAEEYNGTFVISNAQITNQENTTVYDVHIEYSLIDESGYETILNPLFSSSTIIDEIPPYTTITAPAPIIYTPDGLNGAYEVRVKLIGTGNACLSTEPLYLGYIPPPTFESCFDGIQNQGETGIDCGAPCPTACPTCYDEIQNQGETGIDCGGPCSAACPTCYDGIQNQGEIGVDCGGPCSAACLTCTDGIQNGNETGIDCGGSCPPCELDLDISTCGTASISGNTITVSNVVVKNIGTITATSNSLSYYLSKDVTINNNDYSIGTDDLGSLAVNATSTESIIKNISTITPQIPAGTYYIGMRAYDYTFSESNQNNNICYDSSPKFTVTYGCKDTGAHNYNPNATYPNNTTCQTCSDGVKNGDETQIDCGGAKCQPCGNITVTAPTANNTFVPGNNINIKWTDNISENVRIRMYKGGSYWNVSSSTNSDGSYSYTIPSYILDGQYRIKIESINSNTIYDYGDYFTIQSTPTCISLTPSNPYSQDFESFTQGSTSCGATITLTNGWTNNTNDDADWTVDSGGTPSGNTGPSKDSKPGTFNGKYLYLEASSSCSYGKKAILQSPCLDLSGLATPTLSFSYHMYGANQGTLELGVSSINTPHIAWIPVATGNQGNVWKKADGWVLSATDGFQILFRATTGNGYASDIAIDDIQIKEGSSSGYCGDDANTLLLLPFDNTLNGIDGEVPSNSSVVSFTSGRHSNGANIIEYSDTPVLRYSATNNINSQQGTVEAWVKPTWNGNDGKGHTILQYGAGGGTLILKDGANNLRLIINRFSPSGYPEMGVGYNISNWQANQWRHVAFTWGGGQLRLYIDGSLTAQQSIYSTPLFPISDTEFNIGTDAGWNVWQGTIDHLRISKVVRSQAQIQQFMNNCSANKVEQEPQIDTRNYPNPFTHHTTIEYTLAKDSPVTLTVYDASGKQIAVLHDNETRTKGTHTATFEGNLYPAGMYYYTIQAGEYFGTQKMILMK